VPTVKVSDVVYQKIVRFVGTLQVELGRMVTVDDALKELFERLERWENIKVK
jgi:hypothetical protein